MTFNDLKYFVALANELSFTGASKKIFISQQALSKHIKKIEDEYDSQFFERKPEVKLTKEGQLMLESANSILEIEQKLKDRLAIENNRQRKSLAIGMGYARSRLLLPDIFPLYRQRYPNVDLRVVIDSANILERMLMSGEIDIWLGYYSAQKEGLDHIHLFNDQLCIVIPKKIMTNLFADKADEMAEKFKNKLEISHFADAPFLMIPRGNYIRKIVDIYLKNNHITPNIVLEANDIETLYMLVLEGNGITFVSSIFAKKYFNTSFFNDNAHLFLLDDNSTQQKIAIYCKKEDVIPTEKQNFINLCLEIYNC